MSLHDIRRISGLALSLALLATSLSGCTPFKEASITEPITITFACYRHERAAYRGAAQAFQEANPSIKVQLVSIEKIAPSSPLEEEDLTQKIRKLASGADTFLWHESAAEGGPAGLLLDLSPFIEADKKPTDEDFLPGLLERFRWKGGIWGLPAGVNLYVILYDQEAFEEAGVKPPTQGWTWDDLLNKAKQLTVREGEEVIRYGFADLFRGSFYSAVVAHGGRLVDDSVEPPVLTLDDPRTVEAVRWYVDLALAHKVMPPLTQAEAMQKGLPPDLRGKAAMWVNPAELGALPLRMRPNLEIAPLPEGSPLMVSGYFISAGTPHPQEAWRWLQFLSRHVAPPGQLPARRGLISDSTYAQALGDEVLAILLYAVEHALPPIRPAALMKPVEEALEAIFAGEEALAKAQEEAMAEIAKGLEKERTTESVVVATPRPESEAKVSITFFWPMPEQVMEEYRLLAEAFSEIHPETEVVVIGLQSHEVELLSNRTLTDIIEAKGADCILTFRYLRQEDHQALLNLQPFIEADPSFPLEDYYPQALESVTYDGSLWGIPAAIGVTTLRYKKTSFDEAGLPYPDVDWTWEDFFETAKRLSKGEGAEKRWGLGMRKNGIDLVLLLEAMSGGLVDDLSSPREFRFDAPQVIEAAQRLVELGRANAIGGFQDDQEYLDLTSSGRVAMWLAASADSVEFARRTNTGIASLPEGRQGIATQFVPAYCIAANTPYPKACWEWIKFLSDRIVGGLGVPPRRSLAGSDAYREKVGQEGQAACLKALEYEDSSIFKGLEGLPRSWMACRFLDEALEELVWEGADVQETLAEAQRKAEAYVDCLRRSEDPQAAAEACFKEAGGEW